MACYYWKVELAFLAAYQALTIVELEPAERNPAELRRTAFILVGIMIFGAAFVLYAYVQSTKEKMDPNRPPIVTKISKKLKAQHQHGKLFNMFKLEGKAWFAVPVSVSQLEENQHALKVMRELQEHYADNENVHFVLISVEGVDQGVGPEQLAKAAKELGMTGERTWWLTTGETDKQRGFIKDVLRLGIIAERDSGDPAGKWKFPSQLALIDRDMHLRQRYDFREAHEVQQKTEMEVEKNPDLKDEENIGLYLRAYPLLKEKLLANTEYVLAEIKTGTKGE